MSFKAVVEGQSLAPPPGWTSTRQRPRRHVIQERVDAPEAVSRILDRQAGCYLGRLCVWLPQHLSRTKALRRRRDGHPHANDLKGTSYRSVLMPPMLLRGFLIVGLGATWADFMFGSHSVCRGPKPRAAAGMNIHKPTTTLERCTAVNKRPSCCFMHS